MGMIDVQWAIVGAVAGPIGAARAPGKDPRGRKPRDPRAVLVGVFRSNERAHVGKTFPRSFRPIRPATSGFKAG